MGAFVEKHPASEAYVPELKLLLFYHRGDLEGALTYANKAFALHPNQEFAKILDQPLDSNAAV